MTRYDHLVEGACDRRRDSFDPAPDPLARLEAGLNALDLKQAKTLLDGVETKCAIIIGLFPDAHNGVTEYGIFRYTRKHDPQPGGGR
jgi:hypothetical protein